MATNRSRQAAVKNDALVRKTIAHGDFNSYDVSQKTIATAKSWYQKVGDYSSAISLLDDVAQAIFKVGQGSSGGPVATEILAVYMAADMKPDATNKGRVLTLLRQFPPGEPSRKKFIAAMIDWSSTLGEFPAGDPELHHAAGSLYAQERVIGPAEYHLVLGTKDSAEVLARLHYAWYKENDPHLAPLFCARSVLPYLLMRNLRAANTAYHRFIASLIADHPNLSVQELRGKTCEIRVIPSLPLLNFLGFLLLAIQRGTQSSEEATPPAQGNAALFTELKSQYQTDIKQVEWEGILKVIAEMYFQITEQKTISPFDMIGRMLAGGMGGPSSASTRR